MNVCIKTVPEFDRRAKRLAKKYVTLLTIYDKSEIDNVSNSYIISLIKEM